MPAGGVTPVADAAVGLVGATLRFRPVRCRRNLAGRPRHSGWKLTHNLARNHVGRAAETQVPAPGGKLTRPNKNPHSHTMRDCHERDRKLI